MWYRCQNPFVVWPPHLPGSESKPIYLSGEVAKVAVVEETGAEMAEAETDPEDSLVAWAEAETELRKDRMAAVAATLEVAKAEEECVVGAGVKQVDSEAEETQVETAGRQEVKVELEGETAEAWLEVADSEAGVYLEAMAAKVVQAGTMVETEVETEAKEETTGCARSQSAESVHKSCTQLPALRTESTDPQPGSTPRPSFHLGIQRFLGREVRMCTVRTLSSTHSRFARNLQFPQSLSFAHQRR